MRRAPVPSLGLGLLAGLIGCLALLVPASASAADGYLGVQIQDVDETLAAALDLEEAEGVLISEVIEESPAAKAGLQRGDLVLQIGERAAVDARRFTRNVRRLDAGETVPVEIVRRGERMTLQVTLGEVPQNERFGRLPGRVRSENGDMMWFDDEDDVVVERAPNVFFGRLGGGPSLGVSTHGLGNELGRYFGTEQGALVLGVEEDSPAATAGLQAGDVIVSIDDEPVEDTMDLHEVIGDHEPGDEVAVRVLRDRRERTITVELGEDETLHMVRGLRGPHHAPRALHLEMAPRVEFRDQLDHELEALRERLKRLEEQLEELDR